MAKGKQGSNDNVKVMVRVRPFNKKEIDENGGRIPFCTVDARQGVIQSIDPDDQVSGKQEFAFDHVFWSIPPEQLTTQVPFATQEDVFEHAGLPAIESLFDGFNGCIFAYGQTSSGKTHTMMGYTPPKEQRGLIPRLCEELFSRIHEAERKAQGLTRTEGANRKVEFAVSLSYLEIYNEKVLDLLTPKKDREDELKVQYDPNTGPTVKGLKAVEVRTWAEVERQFDLGSQQRSVAATAMNAVSSRSHAVVQIVMTQKEVVAFIAGKPKIVIRQSRINLVDLAGSEKVAKSQVQGQGLREAIGINASLTCLGRVIDGLVKGDKHVPYRDSVLTQLLSDSLGGNARTTMLAALSPAAINFEETVSTLRYASRARQIVNVVKVNEDPTAQLIRELQDELARMKAAIQSGDTQVLAATMDANGSTASMSQDPAQQKEEMILQAEEIKKQIAEVEHREAIAAAKIEEKEQVWAAERNVIQKGHEHVVAELQQQKQEIIKERNLLEQQARSYENQVQQKQQQKVQLQEEHEQHLERKKSERRENVKELAIKLFQGGNIRNKLTEVKQATAEDIAVLKRQVAELQKGIAEQDTLLEGHPYKYRGMYQGQIPSEGHPICEMCLECPASWVCHDCSGERLCNLCNRNQHHSTMTSKHSRAPLMPPPPGGVILCDFCGEERAVWTCQECVNGRLCEDCDDVKHRNQKRNFHHRYPGVGGLPLVIADPPPPRTPYQAAPPATMLHREFYEAIQATPGGPATYTRTSGGPSYRGASYNSAPSYTAPGYGYGGSQAGTIQSVEYRNVSSPVPGAYGQPRRIGY